MKFKYKLPQKAKLIGVAKIERPVLTAVSETDSSTFPLEREVMKLEILPPGQAATRIIPSPIIGLIQPVNVIARRKVKAGRKIIWQIAPRITDLGFFAISTKVLGLIPRATPNITNARTRFKAFIPASFMFTIMLLIASATSGFIYFGLKLNTQEFAGIQIPKLLKNSAR
jgi:hypothetical protein